MNTISIRRATEDEWEVVRDVRLTALREAPCAFGSTYQRERDFHEETWRSRLRNPDGPTFLAFRGTDVVGIDGVFTEDGDHYLVAMWVAPSARRNGVAMALTQAVIDWASERDARRVMLAVAQDNVAARRLYEQLGFTMTGSAQPLDSDPTRTTDEMELRL